MRRWSITCWLRSPIAGLTISIASSDTHASIGTRRLSIIDLEHGRQPMSNEDRDGPGRHRTARSTTTLSSCDICARPRPHPPALSRHRDDRSSLRGVRRRLRSKHLRGDVCGRDLGSPRNRRLVLAGDRTGREASLLAACRRAALIRLGVEGDHDPDRRLERIVDQDALALYLRYQYVPAPQTILRGRPGCHQPHVSLGRATALPN